MENGEERLGRLEENGYFLEERMKALDGQITAQQAELENLAKKVEQLQDAMVGLRELLELGGGPGKPELPPHHIAKFW